MICVEYIRRAGNKSLAELEANLTLSREQFNLLNHGLSERRCSIIFQRDPYHHKQVVQAFDKRRSGTNKIRKRKEKSTYLVRMSPIWAVQKG